MLSRGQGVVVVPVFFFADVCLPLGLYSERRRRRGPILSALRVWSVLQ